MILSRTALVGSAILGLCVVPLVLSGCSSTEDLAAQRDAVDGFADALEDLPFVRDTSVTTNRPLPWSLTAAVSVDLEPVTDRAAIDELHDLACSIDVSPSPTITLNYLFASGATLTQTRLGQCWEAPAAFVEAIPALTAHESVISRVDWEEDADEDGTTLDVVIGLNEPSTVAGSTPVAGDLLASLPDDGTLVSLRAPGIEVASGPLGEVTTVVAVAADLTAKYPLLRVTFDDVLFVELATDAPGVTDEVLAYLQATYPGLSISAVVDSTDAVDGAAPAQDMLDVADLVRESGLAKTVRAGERVISVTTTTTAANLDIVELLQSEGHGDARVRFTTELADGPVLYIESGSRSPVAAIHLEDAEVIVNALSPLGTVDSVHYEPDHLKVYLADDVYDDKASLQAAEKALRNVVDSGRAGAFSFVELNNRSL
jgi:hypothetical protein